MIQFLPTFRSSTESGCAAPERGSISNVSSVPAEVFFLPVIRRRDADMLGRRNEYPSTISGTPTDAVTFGSSPATRFCALPHWMKKMCSRRAASGERSGYFFRSATVSSLGPELVVFESSENGPQPEATSAAARMHSHTINVRRCLLPGRVIDGGV